MIGHGGTHLALVGGAETMSHVPIALKRPVADKLVATFPRDPAGAADMLTQLTAADFDLPLNAWANRVSGQLAGPAHRGHRARASPSPARSRTAGRCAATSRRSPARTPASSTT